MEALENAAVDAAKRASQHSSFDLPIQSLIFLFDDLLGESQLARFLVNEPAFEFVQFGYHHYLENKDKRDEVSWWMRGSDDGSLVFLKALEEAHVVGRDGDWPIGSHELAVTTTITSTPSLATLMSESTM